TACEFDVGARSPRIRAGGGGGARARAPAHRAFDGHLGRASGARARVSDGQSRPRPSRRLPPRRWRLRRVGDGRRRAVSGGGVDRQQPDLRRRATAPGRGPPARCRSRPLRAHDRARLRRPAAGHDAIRRPRRPHRGHQLGCGRGTPHPRGECMTIRSLWAGRALALLGVLLVALSLRTPVAAMSPILDRIGSEIPLDAFVLGLIAAAPPLAFAASSVVAPLVARRLGLEPALVASLLAMMLGHLFRAVAPEQVTLVLGTVLALLGVGIGNVLLPPIVRRYFPDRDRKSVV